MEESLKILFDKCVEEYGMKCAIKQKELCVTYKELDDISSTMAKILTNIGIKKGNYIVVAINRDIKYILAILAIIKINAVYVPIDINYPKERINFIIEDVNPSLIITCNNCNIINNKQINVIDIEELYECEEKINKYEEKAENRTEESNKKNRYGQKGKKDEIEKEEIDKEEIDKEVYIMYTSGSSGNPKGVVVGEKGIINLVKDMKYVSTKEKRVAQIANICFDASTFEIWGTLINGGTLIIYENEKTDSNKMGKFIEEEKIETMFMTTALFHLMVAENINSLRGVKELLVGGEVISQYMVKEYKEKIKECSITNIYGPTENTTFSTFYKIDKIDNNNIPIGIPIQGCNVYILNEKMETCEIGEIGELYLGGKGVALKYLKNEELTEEKFKNYNGDRIYKTGDLVRHLNNNNLEFIGRKDNQVKIRGFRLELNEIENQILQYKDIKSCCVKCIDIYNEKKIIAFLVPTSLNFSCTHLKNYLKHNLPEYMLPNLYSILNNIPFSSNGKISLSLTNLNRSDIYITDNYIQPYSPIQLDLVNLFQNNLSITPIGINDNLFDLGATSISVANLSIKISKLFSINISSQFIYEYPTINQISQHIDSLFKSNISSDIVDKNSTTKCVFDHKLFNDPNYSFDKLVNDPNYSFDKESNYSFDKESNYSFDKESNYSFDKESNYSFDKDPILQCNYLKNFKNNIIPFEKQDNVMITGATGFLGAYLVRDLLKIKEKLYCLVRCKYAEIGLKRIRENMEKYKLWKSEYENRLIIVPGDLQLEFFGLSSENYNILCKTIDVIYHNAAMVNYITNYNAHRLTNVIGTFNIIKLATSIKLKKINFISTIAVFGPYFYFTGVNIINENTSLDTSVTALKYDMGYSQSKWVAEKLLLSFSSLGLPLSIFRPGFIMGDSITGCSNTDDFMHSLIKGCIHSYSYPLLHSQRKEFVPVDYVSSVISFISSSPSSSSLCFHIVPPSSSSSPDIISTFNSLSLLGYHLSPLDYSSWVNSLISSSSPSLSPFLSLFYTPILNNLSVWQLYTHMSLYDSSNTSLFLSSSSISFSSFSSLLPLYFNFWLSSSFLPSPISSSIS